MLGLLVDRRLLVLIAHELLVRHALHALHVVEAFARVVVVSVVLLQLVVVVSQRRLLFVMVLGVEVELGCVASRGHRLYFLLVLLGHVLGGPVSG